DDRARAVLAAVAEGVLAGRGTGDVLDVERLHAVADFQTRLEFSRNDGGTTQQHGCDAGHKLLHNRLLRGDQRYGPIHRKSLMRSLALVEHLRRLGKISREIHWSQGTGDRLWFGYEPVPGVVRQGELFPLPEPEC